MGGHSIYSLKIHVTCLHNLNDKDIPDAFAPKIEKLKYICKMTGELWRRDT